MRILGKIGKWLLILIGSIIGFILIILLVIRINSSGLEEQFIDAQGEVLPNSIAMHEDMVINGAPQRITIRGENKDNPVLLMVHGGPGNIAAPFGPKVAGYSLEDVFTVCYWEQRGAGIAYSADLPDSTITLEQIVDDGLEVVKYLRRTFNKDQIYIEGTSWGTTVSAYMVQKKPELFQAYIGVGQMANQPLSEQMSYDFVLAEAQKLNDTHGINELKRIGRPPYPDKSNVEMAEACDVERLLVQKYVPMRRNPGFKELIKIFLNNGLTINEKFTYLGNNPEQYYPAYKILWPTCFNINLIRDVPDWEIPVYIMHGDNDHYTETSVAKAYFDSLNAPSKKWYLFENATHAVQYEYPEKYRSIYIDEILKKKYLDQ